MSSPPPDSSHYEDVQADRLDFFKAEVQCESVGRKVADRLLRILFCQGGTSFETAFRAAWATELLM